MEGVTDTQDSAEPSNDAIYKVPALLLKLAFTPVGAKPGVLTLTRDSIRFVTDKTSETLFALPLSSIIGYENKWAPVAHFSLRTPERNYKFYFQGGMTMEHGKLSHQIGEELGQALNSLTQ